MKPNLNNDGVRAHLLNCETERKKHKDENHEIKVAADTKTESIKRKCEICKKPMKADLNGDGVRGHLLKCENERKKHEAEMREIKYWGDKLGNIASVLSLSADHNLLFVGHENGNIKIWHNDVLLKSIESHKGAIFSVNKNGKWLFSGGWDKTINVQEISEDVDGVDVTAVGSIACNSTTTALLYWHGKLFVGQADRIIKV
ncbi:hypothetical protein DH2020_034726 [Rehmannia glutinosa]|uniref:Uncharacterized protein n=1 Tax=Rehmannia glutinosa TaxID=99300 RepID=A0ABR0VBR2_REHGL